MVSYHFYRFQIYYPFMAEILSHLIKGNSEIYYYHFTLDHKGMRFEVWMNYKDFESVDAFYNEPH